MHNLILRRRREGARFRGRARKVLRWGIRLDNARQDPGDVKDRVFLSIVSYLALPLIRGGGFLIGDARNPCVLMHNAHNTDPARRRPAKEQV